MTAYGKQYRTAYVHRLVLGMIGLLAVFILCVIVALDVSDNNYAVCPQPSAILKTQHNGSFCVTDKTTVRVHKDATVTVERR